MKTRILAAACAVFIACSAYGQSVQQIAVPDATGYPRVVDTAHPLPVTGDLEIGSVTVDAFPVYSDAAGNPATATVDTNNRAIVNIGSDSAGITTTLTTAISTSTQPSNTVATRTITLVANEAQDITVGLPVGTPREFITISAMDIEKDFWLQFGGSDAVINQCMLVNGRVSLPLRGGVDISIIASEAFDVYVLEGGKE
jgi:hypothetical protein